MNRRAFFATIAAAFLAAKARMFPKPKLVYNKELRTILYEQVADSFFADSPLFFKLRQRPDTILFSGGQNIQEWIRYGCAEGTGWLDPKEWNGA